MYFSKTGGTPLSISFSIGIEVTKILSISTSLGRSGDSSGYFVNVPNNIDHFKVYGTRTYDVQVVNIYRNGVLWDTLTYQTFERDSYHARKVS